MISFQLSWQTIHTNNVQHIKDIVIGPLNTISKIFEIAETSIDLNFGNPVL